ncbi:MAG: hypothetical protein LLG04_01720 [Parachlamydia sp.]|nr:hypothetical protein [Parachlamydia sp.]
MNNLSRYSSENLKTFVNNFKVLAHAQEGERGRIDVLVDPKTKRRTYQVAITYHKPETLYGKAWQNTTRTVYKLFAEGHDSEDFFNKLKVLFQDAKTCIEDMQHETDAKKSKRLYRLKEAIQSSEKAVQYLVATFQTSSSSYFMKQKERTTTALEDYQVLAEHIKRRVESVAKAAEEQAGGYVQQLTRLLFPPRQEGGDCYVDQFNANATIPYLNKKGVQTALSKQFGDTFIAQIFEFYALNKPEIEIISPTKVKCLIVSALANLNLEALQKMKDAGDHSFFAPFLARYPGNVKEWTDEQLCECLARVRNFSGDWIKNSLIEKQPQFLKDLKFVNACRAIINYMPIKDTHRDLYFSMEGEQRRDVHTVDKKDKLYYLRHFGHAEFDAKKISYNLCRKNSKFIEGVLYPNFVNNRLVCLEAHKIVSQPGLYAIGAIPARGIDHVSSADDPPYVDHTPSLRVIFRGSSDADSWWRNLSPTERYSTTLFPEGPGSRSYEEAQKYIKKQIKECLKKLKEKFPQVNRKFKIILEGDSLAGTDIQRCLKYCAAWLGKLKETSISAIETYAFSCPGVEQEKADEFIQLVRKLPHIQFTLRYFMADYDVVPNFGATLMGWIPPEKSATIPDNLFFAKFKFAWTSQYSKSSCVQATREKGCVEAVQNEVAGMLEAHKARCLEYTKEKEVFCYSHSTRIQGDFAYIKIGQDMDNPIANKFLETVQAIDEQAMSGLFLMAGNAHNAVAEAVGCPVPK